MSRLRSELKVRTAGQARRRDRITVARTIPLAQMSQHRHHGAHRRRQDDDDRAHPLLYGHHAPYRRGARGHRDHGLDGAGAGARHHDYVGRDDLHLERHSHQHHRHPRPRGLHGRGGAFAARAGRRGAPASTRSPACSRSRRRCGGRRTSTRFRGSASSTRWTRRARTSSTRRQRS